MILAETDGLERVVNLVEIVVRKYEEVIENNFFHKTKLDKLNILVVKTDFDQTRSSFVTTSDGQSITIFVAEKDSDKKIAFVIAHTVAQMMFSRPYDEMKNSVKVDDNSTILTAIKQLNLYDSSDGGELEKYNANTLAQFIIGKLELDDQNVSS